MKQLGERRHKINRVNVMVAMLRTGATVKALAEASTCSERTALRILREMSDCGAPLIRQRKNGLFIYSLRQ